MSSKDILVVAMPISNGYDQSDASGVASGKRKDSRGANTGSFSCRRRRTSVRKAGDAGTNPRRDEGSPGRAPEIRFEARGHAVLHGLHVQLHHQPRPVQQEVRQGPRLHQESEEHEPDG
ncbi:hypothetical protein CEXT_356601 [Caerostris extrusa]|uniref:Uncharacterized protein n=1 Tax=Caerostris extrusa TaxID=172846 RepID=A0AAV4M7X9_CAEEX|nr:hypothetical protein CEXT_356601 [Caerostris extrusa]